MDMRGTLILKVEYINLKETKLSKDEILSLKKKNFQKAFKELKVGIKGLIDSKRLKILKEKPLTNEVDVDYDEKEDDDAIRSVFRKLDVIDIIDLYYDDIAVSPKISAQEELMQELAIKIENIKLKKKK
jgi:hypothetical protein